MNLPFTETQFLDLFGAYNSMFAPVEIVLWFLTLVAVVQLMRDRAAGAAIALLAAVHWAWSGVAYHALYFTSINPAAWLFAVLFVAQAIGFMWVGRGRATLSFDWRASPRYVLSAVFLVYALIYPALGPLTGHPFPRAPIFAVPCPTVLFTAGVLLAAAPPVSRWLFAVPIAWSLVGGSAALTLGITPDFMLFAAAAVLLAYAAVPQAFDDTRFSATSGIRPGRPSARR
jgi:hypothetical protein